MRQPSRWEECTLRHAESGGLLEGKHAEAAKEWADDGSLPLEDGKLPFFLLDAHEEPGTPGTLYLFGKARLQSIFFSLTPI